MLISNSMIHFGNTQKQKKNEYWKKEKENALKALKKLDQQDQFNQVSPKSEKLALSDFLTPDVKSKLSTQANKKDGTLQPDNNKKEEDKFKLISYNDFMISPNGKPLEESYLYAENGGTGTKLMDKEELRNIQNSLYYSSPNGKPEKKVSKWWLF